MVIIVLLLTDSTDFISSDLNFEHKSSFFFQTTYLKTHKTNSLLHVLNRQASLHSLPILFSAGIVILGMLNRLRKDVITSIVADDRFPVPSMNGVCLWPEYDCSAQETQKYRSADGSCNNLEYPLRGRALTPFTRMVDPEYDDGQWLTISLYLYGGFLLLNHNNRKHWCLRTAIFCSVWHV